MGVYVCIYICVLVLVDIATLCTQVSRPIQYPLTLTLPLAYFAASFQRAHAGVEAVTLQLTALVTHIGQSSTRGHYMCVARSVTDQKWRLFNDDRVSVVTDSEVQSHMCSVYLLFYTFVL